MKGDYLEPGDYLGDGVYYFPLSTKVKKSYEGIVREFTSEVSIMEVKDATVGAIVPRDINEINVNRKEIMRLEKEGLVKKFEDNGEVTFTDKLEDIILK